ncbi:MAG TPA: hypothetical protein VFK74_04620 [Azospira sp.]|nr:hypothetical protein [Azospira sp.]
MKDPVLARRAVLRAAVAAGCGWWMSSVFSAEEAKPGKGTASPEPSVKKSTQASVQYQTKPKGELKCSRCANFIPESNTCKVVEGQINPEGWCILWTRKT